MRFKGAVLIFLFAGLLSTANHSQAIDPVAGSNITVKPFLANLDINPGESSKQFDLTVGNNSETDQSFHFSTTDFGSLDETGGLTFAGASAKSISTKYGLTKWVSFSNNNIVLKAGQQTTIRVTINNDSNLSPGAHYAAVITTASGIGTKANQLTITPKVSSLIFVTKHGGEFYNIHLVSIRSNANLWRPPTTVTVRLESTGNTYIIPRGIINLKQANITVSRGIINDQSSIVLPQTIRSFDVPLTNLNRLKNGWLDSSYSLEVNYRYDGVSNYASKTYSYRIVNLHGIISLILMLVIIVTVFLKFTILKRIKLLRMRWRNH